MQCGGFPAVYLSAVSDDFSTISYTICFSLLFSLLVYFVYSHITLLNTLAYSVCTELPCLKGDAQVSLLSIFAMHEHQIIVSYTSAEFSETY